MDEDNSGQIEIDELEQAFADFKIDEVYERPTLELTQINSVELVPRTPKRADMASAVSEGQNGEGLEDENDQRALDIKKLKIQAILEKIDLN